MPSDMLMAGRLLIGSLRDRTGEQTSGDGGDVSATDPSAWVRVIGQSDEFRGSGLSGTGPRIDQRFIALQAGINLYDQRQQDGQRDIGGVAVAAGHLDADVQHNSVLSGWIDAGQNRFTTASLGAYGTHYGSNGWYVDGVLQATWYLSAMANPDQRTEGISTQAHGIGGSVEAGGIPWSPTDSLKLQPLWQLIYQSISIDDAANDFSAVQFGRAQSLASRLGAALSGDWIVGQHGHQHELKWYAELNFWHEFLARSRTSFATSNGPLPFYSDMQGNWGELKFGITAALWSHVNVYVNVNYQNNTDDERRSYGGNAGVLVDW
jgi:outer membrane autotransporter protein